MNLHKILKIVAGLLGVAGIIFLARIIAAKLKTIATIFNILCNIIYYGLYYFLCFTSKSIKVMDASSMSFTILSILAII